jgi:hypothetical protein
VNSKDLVGFQAGHHAQVSGSTGRGKTLYVVNAILGTGVHAEHESPWQAVVVLCDNMSIGQPAYRRLAEEFDGPGGVIFVEGLPDSGEAEKEFLSMLEANHNRSWSTIVVVDDLMSQTKSGTGERFLSKLFTSARHLSADIWELTQSHTNSRLRRLQVGYMVCFATPSDVRALAHVCRSIKPETGGKDILSAYRHATEGHDGHGCLVIVLHGDPQYMLRNTDMGTCYDLSAAPVDSEGFTRLGARLY